jgi:hypothetical protein
MMTLLTKVLIHRLAKKGLLPGEIPGFIRDVANAVSSNHSMELSGINNWMSTLGWNSIELDDHTFQLLIASLDNDASHSGGRALSTGGDSPPTQVLRSQKSGFPR